VGTKKGYRQMSCKELKLTTASVNLEASKVLDSFKIKIGVMAIYLDRNQAHLLKLWLEEHLK